MYRYLRRLFFRLDAEQAHSLAMTGARFLAPARRLYGGAPAPELAQVLWQNRTGGIQFRSPLGLAPGFDKNATHVASWAALGFGFAEVGSVTARPSCGNPKPRAFRLTADRAIINRMGLNNDGAEAVADRLRRLNRPSGFPLGINIAKTHDPSILGGDALDDFEQSTRLLLPFADFLVFNVSCPNTAEGKTFEDPTALQALLERLITIRDDLGPTTPVLVKLSPPAPTGADTGQVREMLAVCAAYSVDGYVISNTASDRAGLKASADEIRRIGPGGLSGRPIRSRAADLARFIFRETGGTSPIIGVGGIDSPETAYERIRAGASLLEIYTGLVYEGPGLVRRIHRALPVLLERDGFARLSDAVGADA